MATVVGKPEVCRSGGYEALVDRIIRAAGTGAEVRLRPQSVSMLASILELSEARLIAIDYDEDRARR